MTRDTGTTMKPIMSASAFQTCQVLRIARESHAFKAHLPLSRIKVPNSRNRIQAHALRSQAHSLLTPIWI